MWLVKGISVGYSLGEYIVLEGGSIRWIIGRNGDCAAIRMPERDKTSPKTRLTASLLGFAVFDVAVGFAAFDVAGSRYVYWEQNGVIVRQPITINVEWGNINWYSLPIDPKAWEKVETVWPTAVASDERVGTSAIGQYQSILIWKTINETNYTMDVMTGELGVEVPFNLEKTFISGVEIREEDGQGKTFLYTQGGHAIEEGDRGSGTWSNGIWTAKGGGWHTVVSFYTHDGEELSTVQSNINEVHDAEYITYDEGNDVAVITSRDGFVEITAAGVSCTAYVGGLAACVVGDKVFCDFGTYAAVWTLEELVNLSFD